jgi:hypothetical protein
MTADEPFETCSSNFGAHRAPLQERATNCNAIIALYRRRAE